MNIKNASSLLIDNLKTVGVRFDGTDVAIYPYAWVRINNEVARID